MEKKTSKKKQKTETVHESLAAIKQMILNLEQQVKELSHIVEQLQYYRPYYPPEQKDPPKYWPVDYPKYKDVTWDAIDKGLQ